MSPTSEPLRDDLGLRVELPARVQRVVSLVPSLTESVAVTGPELLVGATDWCSHPANLAVPRVGGTKNPNVPAIVALRPDLVLANAEENRGTDLDDLRRLGVAVWVTAPTTVAAALASLDRMLLGACRLERPDWLAQASEVWSSLPAGSSVRRAVIPIWRRPWMALGRDTFAGDVLLRLGVTNVLATEVERYPRFRPSGLPPVDLVVLPDEPYRFTAHDGPEAFASATGGPPDSRPAQIRLVSGRHLTWYGPSLAEAPRILTEQLAR